MKNTILIIGLALVIAAPCVGQVWPQTGADAVELYMPGDGAGFGEEYFPDNVLGLPDTSARRDVPSVNPVEIFRLGMGGEIVLRFDRNIIIDGPGADFTVFENAFYYNIGGKERPYTEPAEVAVSKDGLTFIPFPYDPQTLQGCAGVIPTNGDRNPTDPEVSGGDSFNLALLGVDSIRYVRIRDVSAMLLSNPDHPLWDPTINGFELDAVVGVNVVPNVVSAVPGLIANVAARIYPNPVSQYVNVVFPEPSGTGYIVSIVNVLGEKVNQVDNPGGGGEVRADVSNIPEGVYYVTVRYSGGSTQTMPLHVVR